MKYKKWTLEQKLAILSDSKEIAVIDSKNKKE